MITATQPAEPQPSISSHHILNALRERSGESYRIRPDTYTCIPPVQRSQSSVGDSSQELGVPLHLCGADPWRRWIYLPLITDTPVSAEQSILIRYQGVDQVQAIYIQRLPTVSNVFVLLQQDRYDDALMDSLLDLEGEILDQYPDRLFEFHYMPLLEDRQSLPIPASAVQIFHR